MANEKLRWFFSWGARRVFLDSVGFLLVRPYYIDTKNKKRRAFFFGEQNSDTGARAGSQLNPANNGAI